jgi:hypothetical protein
MMNDSAMKLKMDGNWQAFEEIDEDRQLFEEKVMPNLYLRSEVHPDVKESFRIIKQLISFSYFEYKFNDVAMLKSALTIEMALKLRYHELNGEEWKSKKSLELLMKWFEDRNYFEVYNPHFLKAMRTVRNILAHPNGHFFSGTAGFHNIEHVVDMVNSIYEDPILRVGRMDMTKKLLEVIYSFNERMMCRVGGIEYHVYHAWPGFINNKGTDTEIHFYYKPSFEITTPYIKDGKELTSPIFYFRGNHVEWNKQQIRLSNADGLELLLTALTDSDQLAQFEQWKATYDEFKNSSSELFLHEGAMGKTFLTHLRAFHQL